MRRRFLFPFLLVLGLTAILVSRPTRNAHAARGDGNAVVVLHSKNLSDQEKGAEAGALRLDGLFFETAQGRTALPAQLTEKMKASGQFENQIKLADGRIVKISVKPDGANFNINLSAQPDADILKMGIVRGQRQG